MGDNIDEREYDIIIFGATSFASQFVVEELFRTEAQENVKWALSGADQERRSSHYRMKKVVAVASQYTGIEHCIDSVDYVFAELDSMKSLKEMTARAKVVINLAGPYTLNGERVVRACMRTGTHYLDISGENNFIEDMHCKYDKWAKEKNVYLISGCNMSVDLWLPYIRRQFNGHINSIEVFSSTGGLSNYIMSPGVWKSLVHMLAEWRESGYIKRRLYQTGEVFTKVFLEPRHPLKKRCLPFNTEWADGLYTRMIGFGTSLVPRTLQYKYEYEQEKPIQYQIYCDVGKYKNIIAFLMIAPLVLFMSQFPLGRWIIKKWPRKFSWGRVVQDPYKEVREKWINDSKTVQTYVVKGWGPEQKKHPDDDPNDIEPPNERLVVRLKGPEINYLCMSKVLLQCAYTVLKESDKMPENGGAFAPGAAFGGTGIYDRLRQRGIDIYEVGQLKY